MENNQDDQIVNEQFGEEELIVAPQVVDGNDDHDELVAMLNYYSAEYDEVYFVRDMKADYVVAVEGFPARNDRPVVTRNGKRLNCLNYKSRLLSSRERFDTTSDGKHMIGYESISGNDTRLGESERGVVDEVPATMEIVQSAELGISSPFEEAMKRAEVVNANVETDHEKGALENGIEFERYETFRIERVK